MAHVYLKNRLKGTLILLCFLVTPFVFAQELPFNCDFNAYLFQYNDVYALDLASGRSYEVATDVTPGSINAAAYNPTDGYIWGSLSSPAKTIVRIGKDFQTTTFTFEDLPNSNRYVGDISTAGIYYLKGGGTTYYAIDLNPESNTYLTFLQNLILSKNISIHDWAFNAVDGMLYTVEKGSNHLYRINAATGNVEDLGEVPILEGFNYTYGAVYFDVEGNFYVSANQTGTVYIINNVQDVLNESMNSNLFAFGPSSSSNDGARCPTAPVPQEDCANGTDDDGDGLIDCDDPACSGVSNCPKLTQTSGANNGGLESNDRLASLISNRNYNRAKKNYSFNKTVARSITKADVQIAKTKPNPHSITLSALVPLEVIGETRTIESSPEDLLDLTNASDIFTVDYLSDNETIGALMVIKTDNKVYEHSKFICDRFLGAELLSVSKIQLREKDFIKSVIKQADGTIEFALTFSARVNASDAFTIESHWNIDKFEPNVGYYNFQIWANSLDDVLSLGEEVLNLLEENAPIVDYKASNPPPVFVRKANYKNGQVRMEIVNNDFTEEVFMQGGIKKTETSDTDLFTQTRTLTTYIEEVEVATGALFDFGFRLSPSNGKTPDDLFVADAPWGLDNSAVGNTVEQYDIVPNNQLYTGDGYRVERNVILKGETKDYIGVYRAMNPRFKAVDLSEYRSLSFNASGTGTMKITLVKPGIDAWEDQYSTMIALNQEEKAYHILAEEFKDLNSVSTDFANIKVLVFTLTSKNGTVETKVLNLSDITFSNDMPSSDFVLEDTKETLVLPNPIENEGVLYYYADTADAFEFNIYSLDGKQMSSHQLIGTSVVGQNELTIAKNKLPSGLYIYQLKQGSSTYKSGKLVIK